MSLVAESTSQVPLARIIRVPEQYSPRVSLGAARVDPTRVQEFKRLLSADREALPPVICVDDGDGGLILSDGHHRAAAYEQLPREFPTVPVQVVSAPPERTPSAYAFELALEYSAKTPAPLTREEKRAAVVRLLEERTDAADRELARIVGVDHHTVAARRRELGNSPDQAPDPGSAADTTPAARARVSRIAAQLIQYGHDIGGESSDVDYDELVAGLAEKFRSIHPTTARDWAAFWEELFADVRAALKGR